MHEETKNTYKKLNELQKIIKNKQKKFYNTVMLSRTHGQKASPTTFGKELSIFTARIDKQIEIIKTRKTFAKMNGAVGNYNAHVFVLPNVKWKSKQKNS